MQFVNIVEIINIMNIKELAGVRIKSGRSEYCLIFLPHSSPIVWLSLYKTPLAPLA